MSTITVETTITRKYLLNKTKDEIIEHVMRLLDENDKWAGLVAKLTSDLELSRVESDTDEEATVETQVNLISAGFELVWDSAPTKFKGAQYAAQ